MIRKAVYNDIETIVNTYNEHFEYEKEHTAYTIFKKDVYPTIKDAEEALNAGALYVAEYDGNIAGSIIIDKVQPEEYKNIAWNEKVSDDEVMVIHLILVRPSMYGKGVATSFIKFASELAKDNSCKVLRLDTGSQNIPAQSLYKKSGFQIAASASMNVGGKVPHADHLFLETKL